MVIVDFHSPDAPDNACYVYASDIEDLRGCIEWLSVKLRDMEEKNRQAIRQIDFVNSNAKD